MNWFKRFFSNALSFLQRAAKTVVGVAAEEIGETAISVVSLLEMNPELSGSEKRDLAVDNIRRKYPDVQSVAINLAIESALAIIREYWLKK